MIYIASSKIMHLKKVYNETACQTTIDKASSLLSVDPEVSTMDVLLVAATDLLSLNGKKFLEFLPAKHPKVQVVLFGLKKQDFDKVPEVGGVRTCIVRNYNSDDVKSYVDEVLRSKELQGKKIIKSNDNIAPELLEEEALSGGLVEHGEVKDTTPILSEDASDNVKGAEAKDIDAAKIEFEESIKEVEEAVKRTEEKEAAEQKHYDNNAIFEMNLQQKINYSDYDSLKKELEMDKLQKKLIDENTKYAGAVNMLEFLDRKIINIFNDRTVDSNTKMEKIKELGIQRAGYKGQANNILVEKISTVMTRIVNEQKDIVDTKISLIRKTLDTINTFKTTFERQEILTKVIDERLRIQNDLYGCLETLIETYKAMDSTVSDFIMNMDSGLPSENDYINAISAPIKPLMIPQNSAMLANRLITDLQNNRVQYTAIENSVKALIGCIFKLCDTNTEIIEQQQNLIELLKCQRTEDRIIITDAIKNYTSVFIGPKGSGVTSTGAIFGNMRSRKANTIVVDGRLGESSLTDFKKEVYTLDEFIDKKIEEEFVFISHPIGSTENAQELFTKLTETLSFYKSVVLLLDDSQSFVINDCSRYILSATYVTNSDRGCIEAVKNLKQKVNAVNIAYKVAMIDCVIDPIEMASMLNMDMTLVKAQCIPYNPIVRQCTLRKERPWDYEEVRIIYAEALR